MLILKWFGGNKLLGCQLDFPEDSVQWLLAVFQGCGVFPHFSQWMMKPLPRISLTFSVTFLGHSENAVVTQDLKIGHDRLSISLPEVPSYIWSRLIEVKTFSISEDRTYKLKLKKLCLISSRSISENVKGRHFLEDLGVDGKMILKRILSSGECVVWIHLLQNGV
jgi:hypothetical protein